MKIQFTQSRVNCVLEIQLFGRLALVKRIRTTNPGQARPVFRRAGVSGVTSDSFFDSFPQHGQQIFLDRHAKPSAAIPPPIK